jgi:WD40 repeat protein
MPLLLPPVLPRCVVGMITVALLCSSLWGESPASGPSVLTPLWQTHLTAQLTGLDLSWDGQTVAFTVVPVISDGNSSLHVFDLLGRELWTTSRRQKILGVSLADDGKYVAIGSMDFSIALFSKHGTQERGDSLPHTTRAACGDIQQRDHWSFQYPARTILPQW